MFVLGIQASELEPLVGGHMRDTIDGVVLEADEHEEEVPALKETFRFENRAHYSSSLCFIPCIDLVSTLNVFGFCF